MIGTHTKGYHFMPRFQTTIITSIITSITELTAYKLGALLMDINSAHQMLLTLPLFYALSLIYFIIMSDPRPRTIKIYQYICLVSSSLFFLAWLIGIFGGFERYLEGTDSRGGAFGIAGLFIAKISQKMLGKNRKWAPVNESEN
ncbi:MAG TPA: hypothetical protein VFW49_04670 [Fluviicoccus sp.]|nr:hypothetical protein [Fluviicoccus sp.]